MMRKIDYKYFSKAKQIAQVSDFPKVHIGCIAVYQNRIVGIGCNTNKTHPAQKYYNRYRIDDADYNNSESLLPKLHAEINCLNQLKHLDINFSKVKLYIYRTRKDIECGMARPCASCMQAIKDLGIHEIGEYNALISFILVIVLCITFLELLQKIKSIMGIKFKGDLEKETLDNKMIEFETRFKMQEEKIQKYNDDLFEKQKKYHAEWSI